MKTVTIKITESQYLSMLLAMGYASGAMTKAGWRSMGKKVWELGEKIKANADYATNKTGK